MKPGNTAVVTLSHPTGQVRITVEAASPDVVAHVANRIKDVFGPKKTCESFDILQQILDAGRK